MCYRAAYDDGAGGHCSNATLPCILVLYVEIELNTTTENRECTRYVYTYYTMNVMVNLGEYDIRIRSDYLSFHFHLGGNAGTYMYYIHHHVFSVLREGRGQRRGGRERENFPVTSHTYLPLSGMHQYHCKHQREAVDYYCYCTNGLLPVTPPCQSIDYSSISTFFVGQEHNQSYLLAANYFVCSCR